MINLSKGSKLNLTKEAPGLKNLKIGLKWGKQQYDGSFDFDLDLTTFMLDANERVKSEDRVVGYMSNNGGKATDNSQSVVYYGDNTTGSSGDDFDETVEIHLDKVPEDVQKIAFVCTIYEAETRKQKFGMVTNSIITGMDADNGDKAVFEFDLGEDFSSETALIAAEVYKHNGDWKFNSLASGYDGGLVAICKRYGIDAEGGI